MVPSSPDLSPLRVFLLFAESDPSLEEHTLIIIPSTDISGDWVADAAAQFARCGVCRERAPSTLRVSTTFEVPLRAVLRLSPRLAFLTPLASSRNLTIEMLSGFICCESSACAEVSQLRADTRLEGMKFVGATKKTSTPTSVLKACAYCATSREMVHTFCCGRCRTVRYCDQSCQRLHWPFHRRHCIQNGTVSNV
jgi:hypothetical protein